MVHGDGASLISYQNTGRDVSAFECTNQELFPCRLRVRKPRDKQLILSAKDQPHQHGFEPLAERTASRTGAKLTNEAFVNSHEHAGDQIPSLILNFSQSPKGPNASCEMLMAQLVLSTGLYRC